MRTTAPRGPLWMSVSILALFFTSLIALKIAAQDVVPIPPSHNIPLVGCQDGSVPFNGTCPSNQGGVVLLGPAFTPGSSPYYDPIRPGDMPYSETHKFEPFTIKESTDLSEARKRLSDLENSIRRAHGENLRNFTNGAMTADCRTAQTSVTLMEDGVLVTTSYAGRGGNPGCY